METKLLYSVCESAEALGIGRSMLYELIATGRRPPLGWGPPTPSRVDPRSPGLASRWLPRRIGATSPVSRYEDSIARTYLLRSIRFWLLTDGSL